jgi:hypothetical protein
MVRPELRETRHVERGQRRLARPGRIGRMRVARGVRHRGIAEMVVARNERSGEVGVVQPRRNLVLRAAVDAGVEVACRAGLHAVAAGLHVPEQRLAQTQQRGLVLDDAGSGQIAERQIGLGAGNGDLDGNAARVRWRPGRDDGRGGNADGHILQRQGGILLGARPGDECRPQAEGQHGRRQLPPHGVLLVDGRSAVRGCHTLHVSSCRSYHGRDIHCLGYSLPGQQQSVYLVTTLFPLRRDCQAIFDRLAITVS